MIRSWVKKRRMHIEALALTGLGVVIWLAAIRHDAFETLAEFVETHESLEVDEVLTAVVVIGLLGLIYALSRLGELHGEIRKRSAAERDVNWIANHDSLTRLPNRAGLNARLDALANAMGPRGRIAYYSIDLDGFKRVNDLLGHQSGDEVLIAVAERLRAIFEPEDIFRLGGDEFVVIEKVRDLAEAAAKARRVTNFLCRSYELSSSMTAELGASVGLALDPDHIDRPKQGLLAADAAMYEAKKRGKGIAVVFEQEMKAALEQRAALEISLRDALKKCVITPHYQPLIDLKTGSLRGFEALARWMDNNGRQVSPIEFIGLAEETGLIVELSDQLLKRACRDAAKWPPHLRLAFNLSPAQFSDRLLGLRILRILAEEGLPPNRLEIEVTETAIVKDMEAAEAVLGDLNAAGIHVALDDFGTGYSSLSQLSRFKFDKIKIDRSFVSSFQDDERQEKIVRAMLGLGQGLGIATTAEGIETESQVRSLQALGCDFGQGYLFGKAMPPENIEAFIAHAAADNSVSDAYLMQDELVETIEKIRLGT
ncbi:diguanylate cyclase (GGDEF)-like protein [Rhizobium sp. SG_E_25_P2]|uniref:putative bifunctional diguanylate cyclase/phosphodiesterase n=1 Tax=Rhizobium sp. SG_E_25_P2 TaxID=2879942 RepID=UPI00247625FF|nr:EAL domain-containing protein [Rhizobium sp. SG_E_25_P2]MDH6267784.1 diguanylate cyclase (GGDEF)-like protein [Rhizobium sp. SG_E_25_P2]